MGVSKEIRLFYAAVKKSKKYMLFAYKVVKLITLSDFLYATYIWKSAYKGDIIRLKEWEQCLI